MKKLFNIYVFLALSLLILLNVNFIKQNIKDNIRKLLFQGTTASVQAPEKINNEILRLLQTGNNSIYLRHSAKIEGGSSAFEILSVLDDENKTRPTIQKYTCLSEKGREEAYILGKIFRDFNIPIGEVYSSPICRSQETASLAFEKIDATYDYLVYPHIMNIKEKESNFTKLKDLFFKKPNQGNKVIVGHAHVIQKIGFENHKLAQSGFLVYNHDNKSVILVSELGALAHIYYLQ